MHTRRRPHPASRPKVEILEGRALMAYSSLDPGFGQGGIASLTSPPYILGATAIAIQPDGKVVTLGGGSQGVGDLPEYVIHRYDADGSLDTSFGTAGEVALPAAVPILGSFTLSKNVLVLPDGKIVFGGAFNSEFPTTQGLFYDSELARLDADGTPDTTFGTNGQTIVGGVFLTHLASQADGKVVMAGQAYPFGRGEVAAVVRIDTTGRANDPAFNNGKVEEFDTLASAFLPEVTGVTVDPTSGKIVLAGTYRATPTTKDAEVIRLEADGKPDATFGMGGFAQTSSTQTVVAVAVQPGGKIVVAGNTPIPGGTVPALAQLDADGSADPTFAASFRTSGGPSGFANAITLNALAVQPDGSITVAGLLGAKTAPLGGQPFLRPSYVAYRFLADGSADPDFGVVGRASFAVHLPALGAGQSFFDLSSIAPGLAIGADGSALLIGGVDVEYTVQGGVPSFRYESSILARLLPVATTRITLGDYDGDGKADVAAFLTPRALYAYRPSGGGADVIEPFGIAGAGGSIPAPGDYDGDGKTDVAVYLPSIGAFAIRPSGGGADEIISFGFAGAGQSIPAPGDYDGDGKTDLAVYLPSLGILAYRPSGGGSDVLNSFGFAGAGQTIPAPGDYDGDGKTDVAAYLPSLGVFAIRPSSNSGDEIIPFGIAGAGATIPAPGDYDGDGITDIAAYIPSFGIFADRPSDTMTPIDVVEPFGIAGAGKTIPAPGNYDGDGKTDIAAYLSSLGLYAYRPSGGGSDVVEPFGTSGAGRTIPTSSVPSANDGTLSAASVSAATTPAPAVLIPLTDDLMATSSKRKGRPG